MRCFARARRTDSLPSARPALRQAHELRPRSRAAPRSRSFRIAPIEAASDAGPADSSSGPSTVRRKTRGKRSRCSPGETRDRRLHPPLELRAGCARPPPGEAPSSRIRGERAPPVVPPRVDRERSCPIAGKTRSGRTSLISSSRLSREARPREDDRVKPPLGQPRIRVSTFPRARALPGPAARPATAPFAGDCSCRRALQREAPRISAAASRRARPSGPRGPEPPRAAARPGPVSGRPSCCGRRNRSGRPGAPRPARA